MNFQTWKEQKKVKDSDLVFTRALKNERDLSVFLKLAEQMAEMQPTFSLGLAFLEMGTDLILMGHLDTLFENCQNFDAWRSHLAGLRYPETSGREETVKAKFEKMPWPFGSKVKFERRGDRFGVELKLFVSNPTDLTKAIASLERVKQEMES